MGKVKDVNFTKKERRELLDISWEVFVEIPNKKHAKNAIELLSIDNMRSIAHRKGNIPEIMDGKMITINSFELKGSFKTPGFGDSMYKGDFYNRTHSLHYILDLPDSIGDMVGEGALVISVQSPGNWSYMLQNKRLQKYEIKLTMYDAENYCVTRGGHLVSVGSKEEMDEIIRLGKESSSTGSMWLGGRKNKTDKQKWHWLDGKVWGYQKWSSRPKTYDCLITSWPAILWLATNCEQKHIFLCSTPQMKTSKDLTLSLTKSFLSHPIFHFWWNHTKEENLKEKG